MHHTLTTQRPQGDKVIEVSAHMGSGHAVFHQLTRSDHHGYVAYSLLDVHSLRQYTQR